MSFVHTVRKQKLLSFTLVLFTLAIGIVIGTLVSTGVRAAKDSQSAPGATPLVIPSPVELSNTFGQVAKQVEPSVVNITTTYGLKATRGQQQPRNRRATPQPFDNDDEDGMNEFFRFFGNPFGGQQQPQGHSGTGLGSGVVVDKAGYILTNNHVVDDADRIDVTFPGDSRKYEGTVVGTDAQTDLAVVRIEGKSGLVPAKIGNSDAVQVGDWCIAIGSPFGFQTTVTAGIISALGRDIPGETSQFQHYLQTDAAINPGNSGGPLINIRGEVIGINTAIATRSGGYQGIGFAMPMNTAASVYNAIIKNGKVTRGSIGITYNGDPNSSRDLLRAYNIESGVFVQSVQPGGPADKAGLKEQDVITAVNGKPVKDGGELVNIVSVTPVGSPLDLTVMRDGKRMNFKVNVGDLAQVFPERFGNGTQPETAHGDVGPTSFGMSVRDLTPARRQALGLTEQGGVEVTKVEEGSFADDVNLRTGDILMAINRQPVRSLEDVSRIRGTLKPGDAVAFRVLQRRSAQSNEWGAAYLAGTLPSSAR
jgi:serine protease Do